MKINFNFLFCSQSAISSDITFQGYAAAWYRSHHLRCPMVCKTTCTFLGNLIDSTGCIRAATRPQIGGWGGDAGSPPLPFCLTFSHKQTHKQTQTQTHTQSNTQNTNKHTKQAHTHKHTQHNTNKQDNTQHSTAPTNSTTTQQHNTTQLNTQLQSTPSKTDTLGTSSDCPS